MTKHLPSAAGGDDVAEMLRRRRVRTDDETPEPLTPVAPLAPLAPPAVPGPTTAPRSQGAGMDRRSWYMPQASADALAEIVDDLHYATRQPKHQVLRVLVEVALEHRSEIARRLREK
ncbi:hypothetical protein [Streptomyces nitrosporeus]|uniref:hypothetical protein n=1 Tax=Streptomyces nitrosporeus TaxID=28894 RepID=UPI00167EED48|nr:hypothetical protein [Streptomyces nitrosporeus]GGZ27874.1 hypothetical protein GCM10010327_67870 [Streptomyces nitrosporeus]